MKFFAKDSRVFDSHNLKIKSGLVYDLVPEMAATLNGIVPGILVPYEPEAHTPAPTVVTPPEAPDEKLVGMTTGTAVL